MKKFIAAMLAVAMTISTSCFTVIQADESEKKLYIVRLSQPPVYEAGEETEITPFGLDTVASRQARVQSEQKAFKTSVSKKTDSNIVYEYNQVFNGMAVEATDEEIEVIKNMQGVTGVYESKEYDNVTPVDESTDEESVLYDLGENINADSLREEMNKLQENSGNGEGMVIAIVDSEFDVNHEAYSLTDNTNLKIHKSDLTSLLDGLSINVKTNQVYQNEKIPFVFNYVNMNKDVYDYNENLTHGSHVTGIAAGNSDKLKGIAPNAQLVLMRCGTDEGEVDEAAMLAAINDAVKMKVDVINLSIGAVYANCSDNPYIEVMKNVAATSTELFAAAGNSGMGYNISNQAYTSEVSYDTGGCPAGSSEIAVVGNAYGSNLKTVCNTMNLFADDGTSQGVCNYIQGGGSSFTAAFNDKQYELYYVGYCDNVSDLNDMDITDKIVVVEKGNDLTSFDIREFVQSKGAKGVIFVFSNITDAIMDTEGFPAAVISYDGYEKIKKAKYFQTTEKLAEVAFEQQMHYSSSYAINEYLNGGVQLSARGTGVMSSISDDNYAEMTGTSMASPMATGAYALVKSYLKNKYEDINSETADFTNLCMSMMQNTADIIYNPNQKVSVPYSPRVQGAGYINLSNLTKSDVVLTNKESGKGMVYYGAVDGNEIDFTLCLENLSDEDVTYNKISGITIRDDVSDDLIINASAKVDSSFKMYSGITVPAGEKVEFPVKVVLSEATKNKLDSIFENGFFLDGFITFEGDDVQQISIPFTGFIGDYFKAPVLDRSAAKGEALYKGTDIIYRYSDSDGSVEKLALISPDTDKIVISENPNNFYLKENGETDIGFFQLRGSQKTSFTVKNSDGEKIYVNYMDDAYKYCEEYMSLAEALSDQKEGDYSVSVESVLNSDKSGNTVDSMTFDIYLDNTEPVIEDIDYGDENNTVTVTASDNYGLYCVEAIDDSGNSVDAYFTETDGVYTAEFDDSSLGENYEIYVMDYAYNYASNAEYIVDDTSVSVSDIGGIYSGNIYYKDIDITNNSDEPLSLIPILAIYDKDGELLKTVKGEELKNFEGVRSCQFKVKLTEDKFPNFKIPDDAEIKVYLWDSLENMHPIEYKNTSENSKG